MKVHCAKCNKEMNHGVSKEEIIKRMQEEHPGANIDDALPVCEECYQNLMHCVNVPLRFEQIHFLRSVIGTHLSDLQQRLQEEQGVSQYERDEITKLVTCFIDISQSLAINPLHAQPAVLSDAQMAANRARLH